MHPDVVVVGAGAFGAWTAWHLHRAGMKVLLCDVYGPANSRASSGGESRIIRAGYGPREIYTRWSIRAMKYWRELAARTDASLFVSCGALWIAGSDDPFARATEAALRRHSVPFDGLEAAQLRERFPQFRFADHEFALYEPEAGALLARRAIQTIVREMIAEGVRYEQRRVRPGELPAGHTVFACGPWLPKLFPELLGRRILSTRQDVLFFGVPSDDVGLGPDRTPCWIDVASGMYGLPDLEYRGFKVADDSRGVEIDPDTESRTVLDSAVLKAKHYLSRRVPAMSNAPLVELRVCQYENTVSGDYLIDRHPDLDNTWIAGGGSGHGFKHGPVVGEYVCDLILGRGTPEERFSLASKLEFSGPAVLSSL